MDGSNFGIDGASAAVLHDATNCTLGEGPLWHPLRQELFWFDIHERRLMVRGASGTRTHALPELCTAAGWIDRDRLLIATETGLKIHDLADGSWSLLAPIEAENAGTRSNDGRTDRQGGFWIGTMGKAAEPGSGAIYRWYRGTLGQIGSGLTIPNSICFSPDGRIAYWACSQQKRIMRQPLDAEGWPEGANSVLVDLGPEGLTPDGSVVDAAGRLWNAQWGAARVACYAPDGGFLGALPLPAQNATCPAFIGSDLRAMVCTSALRGSAGMDAPDPGPHGQTFRFDNMEPGLADGPVLL